MLVDTSGKGGGVHVTELARYARYHAVQRAGRRPGHLGYVPDGRPPGEPGDLYEVTPNGPLRRDNAYQSVAESATIVSVVERGCLRRPDDLSPWAARLLSHRQRAARSS